MRAGYEAGVTRADSPIDEALEAGRASVRTSPTSCWPSAAAGPAGTLRLRLSLHRGGGKRFPLQSGRHPRLVEVFLPSLRWVGFDPTNNTLTGERHVTVAIGRDYDDVPPSRGVFKGDAESELEVAVSVRQTRTAAAEPEFLRTGRPVISGTARRRLAAEAAEEQLQQQQQQQQ